MMSHRSYELAKRQRDVRASMRICDDLADEKLMNHLWDTIVDAKVTPIVVAPAMPLGGTNNALGRGFAGWLALQLQCSADATIHQTNTAKRDMFKSPYYRMAQSPTFDGTVIEGAHYILADDLYTLGGTLACLRGFILRRGGRVLCMTTIAERGGKNVQISLAEDTASALSDRYGDTLASLLQEQSGFTADCLTEAEGRYLLGEPSLDQIRAGFSRARDGRP